MAKSDIDKDRASSEYEEYHEKKKKTHRGRHIFHPFLNIFSYKR